MKSVGKIKGLSYGIDGNLQILLELHQKYVTPQIQELQEQEKLDINIKTLKESRTLRQNRYCWALLGEIALKVNGDNKAEDIYINLVEEYGLKYEFLGGIPEAEENLNQIFRVVKKVDERESAKGKWCMYKCYYGSSTFNKEEMAVFIDGVLNYAHQCGIQLDYWEKMLK